MEENTSIKIGSLNVNQFLGATEEWNYYKENKGQFKEGKQEEYENNKNNFKQNINKLLNYIKEKGVHIMILNEIPLSIDTDLFKYFKEQCKKNYRIIRTKKKGYFCTLILVEESFDNWTVHNNPLIDKNKEYIIIDNDLTCFYKNRIVPLLLSVNGKNILLLGAHIPKADGDSGNNSKDKVKSTWFELKNIVGRNILYKKMLQENLTM